MVVGSPLRRSALACPERTLVEILAASVEAHPDAPAMDDGNTVLSYAQLWRDVRATAARLAAAGVAAGDRVGVRLPSGTHLLYVSILGVLAAGAAYVPVDVDDPA